MPQVPSPTAPSISPSGPGTPYQSSSAATAEAFGAGVGRAEQGLGQSIEHFSDVISKHQVLFADRENQAAATDLYTQASIEVGNLDAKFGSLEGKARADALPEYQKGILAIQDKYRGMAGNVDVQHQFDNDFKRRAAYSIVDESKKAAVALKQYNNKVQVSRLSLAQQDAIASARDDQRFDLAKQEVEASIDAQSRENNWGPEEKEVYRRHQIDSLYESRFKAMSITDPFRAKDLYDKSKGEITGPAQLKIEDEINKGIIRAGSKIDADSIWNAPRGNLGERIKKFEGFKTHAYGDYKQFSIGYGTRANSPDEVIDRPEAERRFSSELAKAQSFVESVAPGLDRGTKDALTSLTYNAGTKWAESGLGEAVRSGDLDSIKAHLLQYNQAGGAPNAALIERRQVEASWIGTGGMPTDSGTSADRLAVALDKAKEFAQKRFPDDPGSQAQYEAALQSRLGTLYNTDRKVQREQKVARTTSVMAELLNPSVNSFEQLSPQAQDSYSSMTPFEQDRMNKRMEANAKGIVFDTPDRRSNFQKYWGMLQLHPEQFEDSGWENADLSTSGRDQLFKAWTQVQKKTEGNTNLSRALNTVRPMLNDANIGQSVTDTSRNDHYNQFAGALDVKLREYMEQKKAFPTEEEVKKMAAGLLTEVPGTGWFSNDRAFEVPKKFTDEWTPKFKERFGRNPTSGELYRLYQQSSAK